MEELGEMNNRWVLDSQRWRQGWANWLPLALGCEFSYFPRKWAGRALINLHCLFKILVFVWGVVSLRSKWRKMKYFLQLKTVVLNQRKTIETLLSLGLHQALCFSSRSFLLSFKCPYLLNPYTLVSPFLPQRHPLQPSPFFILDTCVCVSSSTHVTPIPKVFSDDSQIYNTFPKFSLELQIHIYIPIC